MRVDVIPIKELSEDLKQKWLNIQTSNPNLTGPCFHPELFTAAGKAISNIYVAIIYNTGGGLAGFLPFVRHEGEFIAKRIHLCEYEAIIGQQYQFWDINKILKKAGLDAWEFKALADFGNIKLKERDFIEKHASPRVDLINGSEKYLIFLKNKKIGYKDLMYKKRLLERRIGPVRFVPVCNDIEVLHKILAWKVNKFKCDSDWLRWTTTILEYVYYLESTSLSGILSVLYAGDEILASTFNFKAQKIMHGSVTAFNPIFEKYSPGTLLLYYLISELNTLQCRILDFGHGKEQKYKWDFSNSTFPVMSGNFKVSSIKTRIKSVKWLHQGLLPVVQAGRKIIKHLK